MAGGADIIQLRDKKSVTNRLVKTARVLKQMAARHNALLIVNDRVDVAAAIGADGVHIGQGDISVRTARSILGSSAIIGASADNVKDALAAKSDGADYIGVGPIFRTPIKINRKAKGIRVLKSLKRVGIPLFAIGGIDLKNVRMLTADGFKRIAVIRAVTGSRDPISAARDLKKALI